MDWVTIGAAALSSAATAFGKTAVRRLWNLVKKPDLLADDKLFPNGERRQIIRAIKDLRAENEARLDELRELKQIVVRIAQHLKIEV